MADIVLLQSATVEQIMAAYVAASAKIENVSQDREVEVPIKDKNNPGQYKGKYKYKYSTLPGILHHVRPSLTENGIWFTQYIRSGNMITRLVHKSGEWMETGAIPMPDIKGVPQDIGAIVSFFKRYSLSEALGLASEDDGDGEQGDREVSFRSRGGPAPREEREEVEEPREGWGDWARNLIAEIEIAPNEDMIKAIESREMGRLDAVGRHDRTMFNDIVRAAKNRRAVLNPKQGF